MHEPAVPRVRPRWRRAWAVGAAVLAAATAAALALVPGSVSEHEAFVERAVAVDATITDRDCNYGPGRSCTNMVRYHFEGQDHLVLRSRWNRPVGDRIRIAVDPQDPEHFEIVDMGGGKGTLRTVIAFALLTAAGGVVGAVAMFLWQLRRPDRLVLTGASLTAHDRSGRVVRSISLGPGSTWRPTNRVRLTGLVFRDPDGRFRMSGHSWGPSAADTSRRLLVAAQNHGAVRAEA